MTEPTRTESYPPGYIQTVATIGTMQNDAANVGQLFLTNENRLQVIEGFLASKFGFVPMYAGGQKEYQTAIDALPKWTLQVATQEEPWRDPWSNHSYYRYTIPPNQGPGWFPNGAS